MGADKKKQLEKLREEEAYRRLSKRERDLILVYEDKTVLLFGDPKHPDNVRKI